MKRMFLITFGAAVAVPLVWAQESVPFLPSGRVALGANYWASHAATQMWSKWDEAEVEKDLKVLKASGMTILRVFPNWADFQPIVAVPLNGDNWSVTRETRMFLSEEPLPDTSCGRAGIDERMVERFERFCELAETYGFSLIVPLLTGQMTFRNLMPPALVHLDLYADSYALKWEARYLECMVTRLKKQKAIVAWESGNEARILGKCTSHEQAEFWQRYVHDVIRRVDPTRPVIGVDGLYLTDASAWPTRVNALLSDCVTTHPYGMWGSQYLDDMRSVRSMMFAASETAILGDVADRPSFIEEHGARRQEQVSQGHLADYMRGLLWNAWDADCRGMLWWCAFDQTGCEFPPYDWKEPCVELGIFHRDRTPYPALASLKKFAAFQRSLDFALPKAKPNCHFIVSDADVAKAAYILAKQAGLRPSFQSAEQPIRDAACYFLPSATGRANLSLRNWRALKEKVHNGATLYLSLDDTFLDELEAVSGLEIDFREGAPESVEVKDKDYAFQIPSPVRRRFRALTAQPLATDDEGRGTFFVNIYGKGKVYTLVAPMEKLFYRTSGRFASDAYRVYETVCPVLKLVRTHARDVTATEHSFDDGRVGVVVVNNSPELYVGRLSVVDGWRIESVLTDDETKAVLKDGCLELAGNSGVFLMLLDRSASKKGTMR